MAKLYFRHGTMDSAKTLNLLAVAHNYRQQGKRVLVIKPHLDTRDGREVKSRSGLSITADVLADWDTRFRPEEMAGIDCLLVDEAQFLSEATIDSLRLVAASGVPVICYGLRTDFRTHLFEGSRRLLEVADSIEEVKVTCQYCHRKAIFNLRLDASGQATLDGPQVSLGTHYVPACFGCYNERIGLFR